MRDAVSGNGRWTATSQIGEAILCLAQQTPITNRRTPFSAHFTRRMICATIAV
jgi:hypothetical protein